MKNRDDLHSETEQLLVFILGGELFLKTKQMSRSNPYHIPYVKNLQATCITKVFKF